MLEPSDRDPARGDEDRPIGDLVQQLVDDGKDYAQAELNLAKARAFAKWDQADRPLAIMAVGLVCGQAAVIALAVGLFSILDGPLGPLLAAIISAGLFAGAAYVLILKGYAQLKDLF